MHHTRTDMNCLRERIIVLLLYVQCDKKITPFEKLIRSPFKNILPGGITIESQRTKSICSHVLKDFVFTYCVITMGRIGKKGNCARTYSAQYTTIYNTRVRDPSIFNITGNLSLRLISHNYVPVPF